ncbi:MAG: cysteine desulfurase family protein [Desulfatiglandales bacterium]
MRLPIYLDYNATTPVAKEVVDEMLPYLSLHFGNPSSNHIYSQKPNEALSKAREQIARLINSSPEEIYFTSGGTECNNMVIKGVLKGKDLRNCHIITSAVEHPSVLNPLIELMEAGLKVTFLPVDSNCIVDPESVSKAIQKDSLLVTIMHANNETGVIQPIEEISRITREKGVLLHTDAAQSVGKIAVNVNSLGVDLLTVAGHKFYAPKGIGALYIRSGVRISPLLQGGGQERRLRPGTENVPYCVALGKAAELAFSGLEGGEGERIRRLRDHFYQKVKEAIPGLVLNGHQTKRLPNTLNISIPRILASELLSKVSGTFVASTGAACHDRDVSISHVLSAMGLKGERALGAIRVTFGRYNTLEESDLAAGALIEAAHHLISR